LLWFNFGKSTEPEILFVICEQFTAYVTQASSKLRTSTTDVAGASTLFNQSSGQYVIQHRLSTPKRTHNPYVRDQYSQMFSNVSSQSNSSQDPARLAFGPDVCGLQLSSAQ
jgi:hypothetical protein